MDRGREDRHGRARGFAGLAGDGGKGRWLLPSLWDLQLAAWGNLSSKDYWVLEQHMGPDTLAKALLFAGIGHGVVGQGAGNWFQRGMKKNKIMELTGADMMRSSRIFCGPTQDSPGGTTVGAASVVPALFQRELDQEAVFIALSLNGEGKSFPPLSEEIFKAFAKLSHEHGLPVLVLVSDAREARQAMAWGGQALISDPLAGASPALFKEMASKHVAWMPRLAGRLDLQNVNGPEGILAGPLAQDLVSPLLVEDFKDTKAYCSGAAQVLSASARNQAGFLAELAQAKAAGVNLLAISLAGAAPGAFQGLSVHRDLQWMVRGGFSPWDALAAATITPARWMGRPAGLADGAPADLLVLDADPTADIHNTEKISAVCVDGRWANRERLKPDLWRRMF